MRFTVVAVGRLRESYWREAEAEYRKRLTPYARIEVIEVPDRDVSADEPRALAQEAEGVLRALPENARVAALEAQGVQRSSEEFARWIDGLGLAGQSHVAFVIGGAAGLHPRVLARADERLSFGKITLPHQLARVVLFEQLYRAFRISRGEPYHR